MKLAAPVCALLLLAACGSTDSGDEAAPANSALAVAESEEQGTDAAAPSTEPAAATTAEPTTTAAPTTTAKPTTTVPSQQPLHFEGTGPTVFALDGLTTRAVTVTATHNGTRNFIATAFDAGGARDGGVINEIGAFTGTMLLDYYDFKKAPPASMEVEADGSWTIDIQPLAAAPVWDGVSPLAGSGKQVYSVSPPAKAQRVTLTHDGSRNFIVGAYSKEAFSSGGLVNAVGAYNGQKMMAKDVYLIAVQADGNWSITPG